MENADHTFSALKKSLGLTIKALRREQHISQEELAHRAGLHRTYVADVERGSRNISLESIAKLSVALGTTIAGLFAYPTKNAYMKFRTNDSPCSLIEEQNQSSFS